MDVAPGPCVTIANNDRVNYYRKCVYDTVNKLLVTPHKELS
jgi:hypothetical protein